MGSIFVPSSAVDTAGRAASEEGAVLDPLRKPVPTARITLVPERSRRQIPLLYKVAVSDSKGRFGMCGVVPGQYGLFAWESLPGTAYINAEFRAARATPKLSASPTAPGV